MIHCQKPPSISSSQIEDEWKNVSLRVIDERTESDFFGEANGDFATQMRLRWRARADGRVRGVSEEKIAAQSRSTLNLRLATFRGAAYCSRSPALT
jgi:hypothetical protein